MSLTNMKKYTIVSMIEVEKLNLKTAGNHQLHVRCQTKWDKAIKKIMR